MWIFGRHRHLGPRVLSEYLDGLLNAGERARVSRALASCLPCREELDGLQSVVSLLHGLEDLPIPRSFTLAGPPPVPVVARSSLVFRAPNWAYAGAASLAGLALAVMVSADATGMLTSPHLNLSSSQESVTIATAPEPAAATTVGESEALPTASPEFAAAPEAEPMKTTRAADATDNAGGPEIVMAPPVAEPAQVPSTDQQAFALEATPAPQPTPSEGAGATGPSERSGPDGREGQSADQAPGPVEEAGPMTMMSQAAPESGATEVVPTSGPSPAADLTLVEKTGTPLVWRALEGAAAAIAALLLAVLALKWRRSRRTTR